MVAWLQRNPLVLGLLFIAAALVAVIAYELGSAGRTIPTGPSRKVNPAEAKLLPPLVATAPEQAYPETAARPLWVPTRRPAPQPVAAPPSMPKGQFVLQGVTIAGGTRIAMLREKSTGRIHRVEQGRDVNGLRLAQVDPDSVTLAQGEDKEVLNLLVQRPGATPGAPPGPQVIAPFPGPPPGIAPPPAQAAPAPQASAPAPAPAGPFAPAAPPAPAVPGAPGAPGAPGVAAAQPGNQNVMPGANPQGAPMTPEELLARRRARRAQQPQ